MMWFTSIGKVRLMDSKMALPPDVEAALRKVERQRWKDEARASGRLDGRAWLDPDAGKPMPKPDLLPPNLCGFHTLSWEASGG